MNSITIHSTEELLLEFKNLRNSTSFRFRGQSVEAWSLLPKAGRHPFSERNDFEIFRNWKRRAKGLINREQSSNMDLLTIAQHYGLATRLLDWSLNPLIATYFACNENHKQNGEIFIYESKVMTSEQIGDPFKMGKDTITMMQPEGTSTRLNNQLGYFTLHDPPNKPLNNDKNLRTIKIPSDLKQDIIFMLNQFGINNLSVFPDIEGLTKHLNWFYSNYNYWTNENE